MKNRKALSIFLALVLLMSGLPFQALAEEVEPREVNPIRDQVVEELLEAGKPEVETKEEGQQVSEDLGPRSEEAEDEPEPELLQSKNSDEDLEAAEAAVKKLEETKKGNFLKLTIAAKEAVAKLEDSEEKTALVNRIEEEDATLGKVTFHWTLNEEEKSLLVYDGKTSPHPKKPFFKNEGEDIIADDINKTRVEAETTVDGASFTNSSSIDPSNNTHTYEFSVTSKNSKKTLAYRIRIEIKNPEKSKEEEIQDIIDNLTKFYEGTSEDWSAMAMAFLGHGDKVDHGSLISTAQTEVEIKKTSTDLERVTISMTSLGYDVTKFPLKDGRVVNIIEEIANYEKGIYGDALGTLNGYIFALIAYDSGNYEIPAGSKWTREACIDYILKNQLPDKGWNLYNKGASDIDITAMKIQGLAPYYQTNTKVKSAVDEALEFLSNKQVKTGPYAGAYGGWGTEANSNSTAMVIVALNSLGMDADKDPRFVKNGKSALDGLLSFKTADNFFCYKQSINF